MRQENDCLLWHLCQVLTAESVITRRMRAGVVQVHKEEEEAEEAEEARNLGSRSPSPRVLRDPGLLAEPPASNLPSLP